MLHKGTGEIEPQRLLLRRFNEGDVKAAYHNWTSDDKVTEYLRWPTHTSIDITESVIRGWIESYEKSDFYQWAIVLKDNGNEPIGTIGVIGMNEQLGMVQIGYSIGSKWWKQGITTEAFAAIIPFLFNEVKVNRIEAQHDPNNPASGKVMEKCGLKYEGTLRQADFNNKGIVDAAVYSLLSSEYFAAK